MKQALALVPLFGVALASAAPPSVSPPPRTAAEDYPPCSRTVTDRCIQLHERGVRGQARAAVPVAGDPPSRLAGGDYPPCTAARQDRCTQLPVRRPVLLAERERLRIGERG